MKIKQLEWMEDQDGDLEAVGFFGSFQVVHSEVGGGYTASLNDMNDYEDFESQEFLTAEEGKAYCQSLLEKQVNGALEFVEFEDSEGKMTIKKMQDTAFGNALWHGFHHKDQNVGEMLMLIVSELSEALEADRKNRHCVDSDQLLSEPINISVFEDEVKDTFEDELADAVIRIGDLCGYLNINLEKYIKAKMKYNESRPYKHGKEY